MLSRLLVMIQTAFLGGQAFDLSPSLNDGVVPAGIDVGEGEVTGAFVVAVVVVVLDEGADAVQHMMLAGFAIHGRKSS